MVSKGGKWAFSSTCLYETMSVVSLFFPEVEFYPLQVKVLLNILIETRHRGSVMAYHSLRNRLQRAGNPSPSSKTISFCPAAPQLQPPIASSPNARIAADEHKLAASIAQQH